MGGDRKIGRLVETEEAGRGRAAEGEGPQVSGRRVWALAVSRDSKSKPCSGTGEALGWRLQANPPHQVLGPLIAATLQQRVVPPNTCRRGGVESDRPTLVAQADFILV